MFINHMDISLLPGPPADTQNAVQPGAIDAAVLKAGETLEARVAQILARGLMQLDLGGTRIAVRTQLSLQVGQQLTLQVEQDKGDVRLVILDNTKGQMTAKPDNQLPQAGAGRLAPGLRAMSVVDGAGILLPGRGKGLPSQGDQLALRMTQNEKSERAGNPAKPAAPLGRDTRPVDKPGVQALQGAVSRAVQKAITNQNSLSGVFAEARQLLQIPGDPLPDKVQDALKSLLGLRLSADGRISGADIKKAFSRSGLFLESRLAGKPGGEQFIKADLKTALLRLHGSLQSWLGGKTRPPAPPETRFSPPFKQGLPQGQPPRLPVLEAGSSLPEAGRVLLGEARAALSRLTLLQAASLPGQSDGGSQRAIPEWNFEIPLKLGSETAIAQFRIDSEARGDKAMDERRWNVQISLDVPQTGPVHAALGLRGDALRIHLWAERDDTLAMLRSQKARLKTALEDNGLDAGAISFHKGVPRARILKPGSMMDQIR
jgi:hypothetical protein